MTACMCDNPDFEGDICPADGKQLTYGQTYGFNDSVLPTVYAPFTDAQVEQLNRFQHSERTPEFTCGRRDEHPQNEGVLVATNAGWHCPACDYTQGWAYGFMASKGVLDRLEHRWGRPQ